MKKTKLFATLAACAVALIATICVLTSSKPGDMRVQENVEALSICESYYDFKWTVKLYYSEGELLVKCEAGGEYQCPIDDPRGHA